MLSVLLTLCAILAVIWWLTGASRHRDSVPSEAVDRDVAEKAVSRVVHSDQEQVAQGSREDVGSILYEVMMGVGMEAADAEDAVRSLGYPVTRDTQGEAQPASHGLSVFSAKETLAREAVERALLVGIQLARMDDDYAGVSDEAIAFETLRQRADDVETALFDDDRRSLMDFYSRAVLVLQDRMQGEHDASRRQTIAGILSRFDEALELLQAEMADAMADLPEDPDRLAWGDSEDRRRYYFKMGVTNSLRRSGQTDSLGLIYRFRGVNYDVEEAFQLAGEEEPLLLRAAGMDLSTLVALNPSDIQRLTHDRMLSSPRSRTES